VVWSCQKGDEDWVKWCTELEVNGKRPSGRLRQENLGVVMRDEENAFFAEWCKGPSSELVCLPS
jgi:hypothetical protein